VTPRETEPRLLCRFARFWSAWRWPQTTAGLRTSERRVKHYPGPESALSARQLVDQAFKEYEKAERNRELRALGQLPPPKEHDHAHH
jgi:hypothetical protein